MPYLFGPRPRESPDHAHKALEVFERERSLIRVDWRFPFYIGFTHYFSLGDALAGGGAMAEAARLPGARPTLAGLESRMLTERGNLRRAGLLETITRQENDPYDGRCWSEGSGGYRGAGSLRRLRGRWKDKGETGPPCGSVRPYPGGDPGGNPPEPNGGGTSSTAGGRCAATG